VLGQERDNLDSEYEKLLLEQSAWADYSRIDQVSREQLHMLAPTSKSIVVVGR
jgi:cell division protein FtsL